MRSEAFDGQTIAERLSVALNRIRTLGGKLFY